MLGHDNDLLGYCLVLCDSYTVYRSPYRSVVRSFGWSVGRSFGRSAWAPMDPSFFSLSFSQKVIWHNLKCKKGHFLWFWAAEPLGPRGAPNPKIMKNAFSALQSYQYKTLCLKYWYVLWNNFFAEEDFLKAILLLFSKSHYDFFKWLRLEKNQKIFFSTLKISS